MGPSVRRLYEQGKSKKGAGINASFAVHQDLTGKATDIALAWAVALGSPFVFQTTLRDEYTSDIYGERGILLGAVHGIVECLFRRYLREGQTPAEAFLHSSESITGPLTKKISKQGILAVYNDMSASDRELFEQAYTAAYTPALEILSEIYDEVACGNEITSVVMHGARLKDFPISKIDGTFTWKVGEKVRAQRVEEKIPLNPTTAGVYIAVMMAQIDELKRRGHSYSEIVNESVIEAVDSLCPYMHHQGISYMIDNCSRTARLGARRWAPRFDYILEQQAFPQMESGNSENKVGNNDGGDKMAAVSERRARLMEEFKHNSVHAAVTACSAMRPSVDISLFETSSVKERTMA